jgi:hypothetical protein
VAAGFICHKKQDLFAQRIAVYSGHTNATARESIKKPMPVDRLHQLSSQQLLIEANLSHPRTVQLLL